MGFYDVILLFSSLKGIEIQTTVKSSFSPITLNLQCELKRLSSSLKRVFIEIINVSFNLVTSYF